MPWVSCRQPPGAPVHPASGQGCLPPRPQPAPPLHTYPGLGPRPLNRRLNPPWPARSPHLPTQVAIYAAKGSYTATTTGGVPPLLGGSSVPKVVALPANDAKQRGWYQVGGWTDWRVAVCSWIECQAARATPHY